jgi:hypothetical protein
MWSFVKSILYPSPLTGIDDLKKHITDVDILLRTYQGLEYQLNIFSATKGANAAVYQVK